jgi:tRNA pseudouridine13 synthase
LSRSLRQPLSAFSYAGTKDKTAVTFQHVVVSGVTPDRLLSVNTAESDAAAGIRVGDLQYVERPMNLGGASGNSFSIVLRGLSSKTECSDDTIKATLECALENVKRQGFTNYFGFQRVGLPKNAVRPHHIGERIIAGKWEEALRLVLAVQGSDSEGAASAKQLYLESGDVDAALKLMPLGMAVERQVLQGLKRHGCDAFEQAVRSVPFSRRVMYMHSYQSYLFNRTASFRLSRYGTKVVEGDLIRCDDQVKAVSAQEAEALNARGDGWAQVLLPLPGTNVVLPSNATKEACVKVGSCCEGRTNRRGSN